MTENMNRIADTVRSIFLRQETLPTIDEIIENADKIRNALSALYPLTDEEYAKVKSELLNDIVHTINGDAITLRGTAISHGITIMKMTIFIGIDIRHICVP